MADVQLAVGCQFDDVATVDLHHLSQLGNVHFQERIEIYRGRQIRREAANYGFTRLVQLQLAFERQAMLCFGGWLHVTNVWRCWRLVASSKAKINRDHNQRSRNLQKRSSR